MVGKTLLHVKKPVAGGADSTHQGDLSFKPLVESLVLEPRRVKHNHLHLVVSFGDSLQGVGISGQSGVNPWVKALGSKNDQIFLALWQDDRALRVPKTPKG